MSRTQQARRKGRRSTSPLLLLSVFLATAVFALPAEASLPRANANTASTAALAGAEAVDSGRLLAAGLETPFALLAGDELEKALTCNPTPSIDFLASAEGARLEPPQLASRACEGSFSLHLEPVDFGLNPQRGPPLEIPDLHQGWFVADPKTRIGGFRLKLEDLIGGERQLSLGLHRGYLVGREGLTEDEPPDPWGLVTLSPDNPYRYPEEFSLEPGTTPAQSVGRPSAASAVGNAQNPCAPDPSPCMRAADQREPVNEWTIRPMFELPTRAERLTWEVEVLLSIASLKQGGGGAIVRGRKGAVPQTGGGGPPEKVTSRAARRQAMWEAGIPRSQQPESQLRPVEAPVEAQYEYKVPKPGGGTKNMVVTHNPADKKHPKPHWEAAPAKDQTEPIRRDPLGRKKYTSDKTKIEYDPGDQ